MAFFRLYPTIPAPRSCVEKASICGRRICATTKPGQNCGPKAARFNALGANWPADDLTRTSFRSRIKRNHQEIASDEAYPFLIFRDDDVLTGGLTLGQVKRGVVQRQRLDIGPARHTPGKRNVRPVRQLPCTLSPRSVCTGSSLLLAA